MEGGTIQVLERKLQAWVTLTKKFFMAICKQNGSKSFMGGESFQGVVREDGVELVLDVGDSRWEDL